MYKHGISNEFKYCQRVFIQNYLKIYVAQNRKDDNPGRVIIWTISKKIYIKYNIQYIQRIKYILYTTYLRDQRGLQ